MYSPPRKDTFCFVLKVTAKERHVGIQVRRTSDSGSLAMNFLNSQIPQTKQVIIDFPSQESWMSVCPSQYHDEHGHRAEHGANAAKKEKSLDHWVLILRTRIAKRRT